MPPPAAAGKLFVPDVVGAALLVHALMAKIAARPIATTGAHLRPEVVFSVTLCPSSPLYPTSDA
jgi:hypothetical protein